MAGEINLPHHPVAKLADHLIIANAFGIDLLCRHTSLYESLNEIDLEPSNFFSQVVNSLSMSNWKKSSPELIDAFYQALEGNPLLEMRKMFGYPCTFINGNMCTGLHEENWIVRLCEEDREILQSQYGAKPFAPMKGRVMREYLALPEEVKNTPSLLQKWLKKSIDFTSSLPLKLPKKKLKKS